MRSWLFIPRPGQARPLFEVMFRSALHGARNGLFGGLVLGAFVAWMFWNQRGQPAYALWFVALGLAIGARFSLLHRWALLPDAQLGAPQARLTTGLYLAVGTIWGLAGWAFHAQGEEWARFALLTGQYTLLVMSVIALSWYLPAYIAFATPLCLLIPLPWIAHSPGVGVLVAVGTLFNYFVWLSFAARTARTQAESIQMRFERQNLLTQLARRASDMEQAHQAKSRFLAAASHDLRQPLHAMALMLATARQDDGALRGASLQSAEGMVRSLDEILESLIDAARIEGMRPELSLQLCDAQGVVDQAVEELAPVAAQAQLQLRVRRHPALVMSQPGALLRIVRNLISNALKYTPAGGVLVALRPHRGATVRLEVWDTGVGIPAADMDRIFRPFERLPSQQTTGAGLGLAVVRQLCDSLGLQITVHSRPGRGTMMRVELGLLLTRGDPEQVAPAPQPLMLLVRETALSQQLTELLRQWGLAWQHWPEPAIWEDRLQDAPVNLLLIETSAADCTRLRAVVQRRQLPCIWLGTAEPLGVIAGEGGKPTQALVLLPVEPVVLRAAVNRLSHPAAAADATSPRSPASVS